MLNRSLYYYAFGSQMPGRLYNFGNYRYGFNGKENDNEVKGVGNQQDYGLRIYDGRLGKFLSVDPLAHTYAYNSTYAYAENSPIENIDLDGGEKIAITDAFDKAGGKLLREAVTSNSILYNLVYASISSNQHKDKQMIFITSHQGNPGSQKLAETTGNVQEKGAVMNYMENPDVDSHMKVGQMKTRYDNAVQFFSDNNMFNLSSMIKNIAKQQGGMAHVISFNESYLKDIKSKDFVDHDGNINIPLFVGIATWAHEDMAHVMNLVNSKVTTQDREHSNYFKMNERSDGRSPGFSQISKSSDAYKDLQKIYSAMGGKEGGLDDFLKKVDEHIINKVNAEKK